LSLRFHYHRIRTRILIQIFCLRIYFLKEGRIFLISLTILGEGLNQIYTYLVALRVLDRRLILDRNLQKRNLNLILLYIFHILKIPFLIHGHSHFLEHFRSKDALTKLLLQHSIENYKNYHFFFSFLSMIAWTITKLQSLHLWTCLSINFWRFGPQKQCCIR